MNTKNIDKINLSTPEIIYELKKKQTTDRIIAIAVMLQIYQQAKCLSDFELV